MGPFALYLDNDVHFNESCSLQSSTLLRINAFFCIQKTVRCSMVVFQRNIDVAGVTYSPQSKHLQSSCQVYVLFVCALILVFPVCPFPYLVYMVTDYVTCLFQFLLVSYRVFIFLCFSQFFVRWRCFIVVVLYFLRFPFWICSSKTVWLFISITLWFMQPPVNTLQI